VTTIATMSVPNHAVDILDEHMYRSPKDLIERGKKYDGYDRESAKIFVGEWAVVSDAGNHCTATLDAAVAEAAFMTVLEHNADVVVHVGPKQVAPP
jgi:alpha-L-arabinofuranosidase